MRLHEWPKGALWSGTALVTGRSAEPQMQRTSRFFLKLLDYCSCDRFAVGRGYCCASSQRDLVIAILNA